MKNFKKYRLLYILGFCGLSVCFFVPPMSSAQEKFVGTALDDGAGLAAVEPEVAHPGNSLEEGRLTWEREVLGEDQDEVPAKNDAITEISPADADLGLILIGTAVVENSGKSLAVVVHKDTGRQEACMEGDWLGRFLVKKVLRDVVIIASGDTEMILSMGPARRRIAGETSQQLARLDRKEVAEALPDYMSIVKMVSIRTHFQTGRPAGILIYNIDPVGIFGKIGLKDGDVITAVNGEPLTESLDNVEIYEHLKQGGKITLAVRRGEENLQLQFHVS